MGAELGERGTCWFTRTGLMYWVRIPKNASTAMGEKLTAQGWELANFIKDNLVNYSAYALWRDPIERFISAYRQHCVKRVDGKVIPKHNPLSVGQTIGLLLLNETIDGHFRPQSWYIGGLYKRRLILKDMAKETEWPVQNVSSHEGRHIIKAQLTGWKIEALHHIYAKDYELKKAIQ